MALTKVAKLCAVIKGGTNSSSGDSPNDQVNTNARQIVLQISGQTVTFKTFDATNATGVDALTVGNNVTLTFS